MNPSACRVIFAGFLLVLASTQAGCLVTQFECDNSKPCDELGEVCIYYLSESKNLVATACVKKFEVFGVKNQTFKFQDEVDITFARSFAFGLNPVSIAEYQCCVDKKVCTAIPQEGLDQNCNAHETDADPEQAINCITWDEADRYCEFAQGRLCSEAEWEYSMGKLQEPAGTVREWVGDAWADNVASMPKDGTARNDDSASNGVVRGVINMGNSLTGDPWMQRFNKARHARDVGVGFRCCSDLPIVGGG